MQSYTGLTRACDGLDGAGDVSLRDVDTLLRTNTQYLLGEHGGGRLYETLNRSGVQNGPGEYKVESPTYEA